MPLSSANEKLVNTCHFSQTNITESEECKTARPTLVSFFHFIYRRWKNYNWRFTFRFLFEVKMGKGIRTKLSFSIFHWVENGCACSTFHFPLALQNAISGTSTDASVTWSQTRNTLQCSPVLIRSSCSHVPESKTVAKTGTNSDDRSNQDIPGEN